MQMKGQGRFRAFALCERVEWESVYLAKGSLREFKVTGTTQNKRQFNITDELPSERERAGTVATPSNVIPQQASLDADRDVPEHNRLLALYLKQYPQVRVSYD